MSNIYLQNTLSGQKEKFVPIKEGQVTLYSCGPTVYDYAHIGNFRSFLMSDLLFRMLEYNGYEVTKVQNITDVGHLTDDDLADAGGEDKIAKKAKKEKKDPFAIARFYEEAFIKDETALRILPPNGGRPRATEYITEQIEIAKTLIEKGFAYAKNGSVYFRTTKFESYGELSGNKLKDLIAGARVEVNDEKEHPMDFALWKKADPSHLMQWESPWGQGFPGWHIECSAMSSQLLGEHFDIHTGGEDNTFPHHECEIAQNECFSGKKSVNYWLHAKHLLVEGEKMSKSKGNFFTIRDLLDKGWKGHEIRYALISSHYRSALNFSSESLEAARSSIERLTEAIRVLQEMAEEVKPGGFAIQWQKRSKDSISDDLNVSDALAATFDLIGEVYKKRDAGTLTPEEAASALDFLENDFDQIFDVFPEKKELSVKEKAEIDALIEEREQCRAEKNWTRADQIRDQLAERGIELFDEKGKTGWRVK